ncbi:MAG TPA: ABC transporter permease [Actinomycetota bacterium]|nr:ABC transporter permease [Actinomycetota bacterium]
MGVLGGAVRFLTHAHNWQGDTGIAHRLVEHVGMSLLATVIGTLIALPVGLYIGHAKRFQFLAVSVGNLGRALPSFGVLALVFPFTLRYSVLQFGGLGFSATLVALVLLSIPPILTNTYVGIDGVDPDVIEAARGMGMSEAGVLRKVELPLAVPLIIVGIRTAAVAVVATATLAALVAWGGLGRFIVDGFATRDDSQIMAGAILVALLAIITELLFAGIERLVSPKTSTRVPFGTTRG